MDTTDLMILITLFCTFVVSFGIFWISEKNKENNMKTGIELIAEERQRQIEVEGYSAQHDSQHNASEFVYAAIAYTEAAKVGVNCQEIGNTNENEIIQRKREMGLYFPWGQTNFKPTTNIRDLVKAGALIASAIDRLQAQKGE